MLLLVVASIRVLLRAALVNTNQLIRWLLARRIQPVHPGLSNDWKDSVLQVISEENSARRNESTAEEFEGTANVFPKIYVSTG